MQVIHGGNRLRDKNERWVLFRSHYGFDAFYCQPGIDGAHEKGCVEGEVGWFRRNHLTPMPEVATGDWIRRGDPLCLIGDSGTGKSHLLIALGTAAAEQGYRVRYTLATRLVNELVENADEKQLTKTINRYGRVDLLVIDELGYMELDRRGAELLFQVLTEREEKNAIAIASNQSFSAWTDTFTDPRLCAAIVDRLTYNATIIETGTNSYRLAHTRARHHTPTTGA